MSRRSTPERIDQARRAATLARLISAGLPADRAIAALDAWAARTARDHPSLSAEDWDAAYREIAPQS